MRRQRCEGPETLVTVSEDFGLIRWHESIIVTKLVLQSFRDAVVVLRVVGEGKVVYQCIES